jgi:hypothetical protein
LAGNHHDGLAVMVDRRGFTRSLCRPIERRIVTGDVHRTIASEPASTWVLTVPSMYVQSRLDFGVRQRKRAVDPDGFGRRRRWTASGCPVFSRRPGEAPVVRAGDAVVLEGKGCVDGR